MNSGALRGHRATRPTPPQRLPIPAQLRAVAPRPRQQPTTTFAAFVVVVMGAGLVGLLLLNIAMQNAAFHRAALDEQVQDLHSEEQALDLEVDRLGSPERLAQQATDQGMVPNPNAVFLDLDSGKVIGTPTPARAGTGFIDDVIAAPTAKQEPKPEPTPDQDDPVKPRQDGRR